MDPITLILSVLSIVFAGGGGWAFLSARATAKAADQRAATADWSGLMAYWQAEVRDLRNDTKTLEVRIMFLEAQREDDLQHIADLENHIWQQLPPPPPIRRRGKKKSDPEAP